MAKIDVVVPCYNYGRYLEACVHSVLAQSINDLRVLIIDDASSDNSAHVAHKLAEEDPRVTVKIHSQNQGHIKTYNEGIDWADSDYFLLLSSDDLMVPGAFDRATHIMDENSDVVLTHGKGFVWQDGLPMPTLDTEHHYTWTRQELVREMCAVGGNLVTTPTAIVRTRVQKAIGGYRSSLPHSGDMEMWLRFGAHGGVAWIEAIQAIYRKHSSNMSDAYYIEGDFWHRKAAFDVFFQHVSWTPDFEDCNTLAISAMAKNAFRDGAMLIRTGIRRCKRDRVGRGFDLIRLSMTLDPRLRYRPPISALLKLPGSDTREWMVSSMKQTAGKLLGRLQ